MEYGLPEHYLSSLAERTFCHIDAHPYALSMGAHRLIGFGERLKTAREDMGISGSELGRGLQVKGNASRQTISDWESERHYPNVWQLREICVKLNRSADYFLFGEANVSSARLKAEAALTQLSEQERRALVDELAAQKPKPSIQEAKREKKPEKASGKSSRSGPGAGRRKAA